MEGHPELDFGTPGPLVHFVEKFVGAEFIDALVASVSRRPTGHTVWMVNRVLNVTDKATSQRLLQALRAARDAATDGHIIDRITNYLTYQARFDE